MNITPGMRFGKLTVVEKCDHHKWKCVCDCGNASYPYDSNLRLSKTKSCGKCGKNNYKDCDDGLSVAVTTTNGYTFYVDKTDEALVRRYKWHCIRSSKDGVLTIETSKRLKLHSLLIDTPPGMEVDHIDLDRLNNRRSNLRLVTHQQNQCNQPLQKNNTSGVSGVRFYPARNKYHARIKVNQHDIHLGYFDTFEQAIQARNVGMECMFGDYGRYNNVPPAPDSIRQKVIAQCKRFASLSACDGFRWAYA